MMTNNDNNSNLNLTENQNENANAPVSLSDEKRVKVMSPTMLVLKRFIRNRLAVIGFIILAAMFVFSFVGPLFSSYGQNETFYTREDRFKDYAGFSLSATNSWVFVIDPSSNMPVTDTYTAIEKLSLLAVNSAPNAQDFLYQSTAGTNYHLNKHGDEYYAIETVTAVATIREGNVAYADNTLNTEEFTAAALAAATGAGENKAAEFTVGNVKYGVVYSEEESNWVVNSFKQVCIATKLVVHVASTEYSELADNNKNYQFLLGALNAYYGGEKSFSAGGKTYNATMNPPKKNSKFTISEMKLAVGGAEVARITNYYISATNAFLDFAFKDALIDALVKEESAFTLTREVEIEVAEAEPAEGVDAVEPAEGETEEPETQVEVMEIDYKIEQKNSDWTIRAETPTLILDRYAAPSGAHLLGTDTYGMDVTTRLMHGGQISLMVGFVVVFIELAIGVVLGGIAGYFSGWVDVIIMRLIELFNCIPMYPMLMIVGSILDHAKVSPMGRIYLLMVILGVLYWPGVARIVRGQILSLREQDFMIATEASGIPIRRRIFRHLLPNVVPLLIVQATMGLGGIIITEATLSFLGLGVKDPLASWGAIINQASNQHVMTNYWWVWLPAGLLILLTVLGFNFVGDGLRDAFDPKMKR